MKFKNLICGIAGGKGSTELSLRHLQYGQGNFLSSWYHHNGEILLLPFYVQAPLWQDCSLDTQHALIICNTKDNYGTTTVTPQSAHWLLEQLLDKGYKPPKTTYKIYNMCTFLTG